MASFRFFAAATKTATSSSLVMPPEGRFSTCFSSKPALIMRKVSSRSFLPDFKADFISSEIFSSSAIVFRGSEAPEDGDARAVDRPAFLGTEQQHQFGDFLRRHPLGRIFVRHTFNIRAGLDDARCNRN